MYPQRIESPNSVCKPDFYSLQGLPRADESGSSKRSKATTIRFSDSDQNNENNLKGLVQGLLKKYRPNHSFDFSKSTISVKDLNTAQITCTKDNCDKSYTITRSGLLKPSQINFLRRIKIQMLF